MWAAGFLEGEGSFYTKESPTVSASQVELEPLLMLHKWFGGHISPHMHGRTDRQDSYIWYVNGSIAIGVMMTLFTLMGERRQGQIKDAILKWRAKPGKPKTQTKHARGSII